ncbi:MAG: LamG-like jellyroll fold domain-containing protein, partial [Candidatus Hydrogenedentes bacterium]|nr:LamG-like jellyroll fold domain-containing protein [Candidatus Hydrogenedentota bacterium]
MADNFIRTGAFGNAAFFDNGRNWLEAASSPALALCDNFTISCAIYPFSVDGFRTILWKGDRTLVPEAVNYYFDLRDGKVELKAKDAAGRWVVHSTAPVVRPDAWHFIVVTYAGGTVRIWVNGEECAVHTGENGELHDGLLPNDGPLMIGTGANAQGIAYGFLGLIDEVLIMSGPCEGPSEKDMALWWEAVNGYERRPALAHLRAVREGIQNQRGEELPSEETVLLDNLDAACEEAAESDTENIEKVVATIGDELDKFRYREFYRESCAEDPFLVMPLRTSDRVVKRPCFFEDISRIEGEVSLEAARNEYEGFQLVVTPGFQKGIEQLSIEITDLKAPNGHDIAKEHLEWGWIRPIETEMPDIPVPFVGWIPDAIIEGAAPPPIAPYDFECLYVRVFVPRETVPADYTGVVTVKVGGEKRDIGIHLRVRAFVLPEATPLKMAFSFFEHFYEDWYGLEKVPRETQRALYEFLLEYRIPPNNIYSSKTTYPDLEYLKEERERMTFFTYSAGQPNPGTGTPEGVEESIDRIEEVHNTLKRENLLDDAYFYCFDELAYNAHRIPEARRLLVPLRERIPGIRVMQTSYPEESIRDLFNVWCPIIHHFDRPKDRRILEELRAEGNEIW